MSLLDQLEEDKKKLNEMLKEEIVEEETEEEVEEEQEEEPAKEEPKEEIKEEPKVEEKPGSEPSNSDFARIRRENAALKRKLEERAETKVEEPQEQVELPPVLQELVRERQMDLAAQQLQAMEADFKRTVPDFEDVAGAYNADMYRSVKISNPRWTNDQVAKETKRIILERAAGYYAQGLDPVQEMYEDAKALGYKAIPKEQPKEEEKEEPRRNLAKLAANKERNAGMAGAKVGGRPEHTVDQIASMTPAEWSKLPRSEKDAILAKANLRA